jgi:hypothetical protein
MGRRRSLAILATLVLLASSRSNAEPESPPREIYTIDLAAAGARPLFQTGHVVDHQADSIADFSFIERRPLGNGPFYISGGIRGERYDLQSAHGFPIHDLQDYGGQLSIEYFKGSVEAAYLTLRPGFYFENRADLSTWDVPVEFATGIPITSALNGAIGVTYGRFWPSPVPIAGLSWTINSQWRLDAIFPNPTLSYQVNDRLEAKLTGELLGNGFRSDPRPERSVVQYYIYRAGGNLSWKFCPSFKLTGGAGVEYERVIDFWRAGNSYRATNAPFVRLGLEYSH